MKYYEFEYGIERNECRYLAHNGWSTEPLTWNNKGCRNSLTKFHFFTSIDEAEDYVQQWKKDNYHKLCIKINDEISLKEQEMSKIQKEIDELMQRKQNTLYTSKIIINNYNKNNDKDYSFIRTINEFMYTHNQYSSVKSGKSIIHNTFVYEHENNIKILLESINKEQLFQMEEELLQKLYQYHICSPSDLTYNRYNESFDIFVENKQFS